MLRIYLFEEFEKGKKWVTSCEIGQSGVYRHTANVSTRDCLTVHGKLNTRELELCGRLFWSSKILQNILTYRIQ